MPEFSYVGGAVAPMAEKTPGMTNRFLIEDRLWILTAISSLAIRRFAANANISVKPDLWNSVLKLL